MKGSAARVDGAGLGGGCAALRVRAALLRAAVRASAGAHTPSHAGTGIGERTAACAAQYSCFQAARGRGIGAGGVCVVRPARAKSGAANFGKRARGSLGCTVAGHADPRRSHRHGARPTPHTAHQHVCTSARAPRGVSQARLAAVGGVCRSDLPQRSARKHRPVTGPFRYHPAGRACPPTTAFPRHVLVLRVSREAGARTGVAMADSGAGGGAGAGAAAVAQFTLGTSASTPVVGVAHPQWEHTAPAKARPARAVGLSFSGASRPPLCASWGVAVRAPVALVQSWTALDSYGAVWDCVLQLGSKQRTASRLRPRRRPLTLRKLLQRLRHGSRCVRGCAWLSLASAHTPLTHVLRSQAWDEESGAHYWYNEVTDESSWHRPTHVPVDSQYHCPKPTLFCVARYARTAAVPLPGSRRRTRPRPWTHTPPLPSLAALDSPLTAVSRGVPRPPPRAPVCAWCAAACPWRSEPRSRRGYSRRCSGSRYAPSLASPHPSRASPACLCTFLTPW